MGAPSGEFVLVDYPVGEFSYIDIKKAYAADILNKEGKSNLDDYVTNTYFCPAMSNLRSENDKTVYPYDFSTELIWYISPEKYREVLFEMKKICDDLPEDAWARKIIMIDNWNEWDEGHFVAPSHKFGFKYLQAIREVFTSRNNLPDYRTPQDQGFSGYNKSWKIPDFKAFCLKQLEKNKGYKRLIIFYLFL